MAGFTEQYRIFGMRGEASTILTRPRLELSPQDLLAYSAPDLYHNGLHYRCLFWNVSGPGNGITAGRTTNIHIAGQEVRATAWYSSIRDGPSLPAITIHGFSAGEDEFLDECAIESVIPSELWDGGPTVWTGTSEVTIRCRPNIGLQELYDWCLLWGRPTTMGTEVSEIRNGSSGVLACYQMRDLIPDRRDPFWLKRHFWDLIRPVPGPGDPAGLDMPAILKHLEGMDYALLKEMHTSIKAYRAGLEAVDQALLQKMKI